MNIKDLGTQLLFTTVHIWAEKKDGGKSTGTGFIYSVDGQEKDTFLPFLVTANHVTQDSSRVLVEFVLSENDAPNPGEKFRAEIEGKYFVVRLMSTWYPRMMQLQSCRPSKR